MKKTIVFVLVATLMAAFLYKPAQARIPVAVKVADGNTLASIAQAHKVSVASLLKENPDINPQDALVPGTWLYLPPNAKLPGKEVFALSAPSETELKFILRELTNDTVYRIMGRNFHFAKWMDVPVLAFATGGGLDNPAIAVTLAMDNFNMKRFCYQGIGGAGHGVNIGDMVVASGVIPGSGHGNVAPLQTPLGEVVIGTFWSYYWGEPVIGDDLHEGRLVLTPDASFMEKVVQSVSEVDLPSVNQEVADYLAYFYGGPQEVYETQARIGWTSTGPFVTSDLYLTQLETRSDILAGINGVPSPEFIAVDMEDYGAIHALVEGGINEWCVIRTSVDLAREKIPGDSQYHGVPWEQRDDPSQPWSWIGENNTWGYFTDWDFFYRQSYLVMKEVVADWGLD